MLPQKLREIRTQKRITQDEISGFLEVKRQTYSAYERGVSVPDSLTLKKIADYFGVTTDYFFSAPGVLVPDSDARSGQEQRLLLLSRRAEKIPQEQRDRIIKNFEENIELYLAAMTPGNGK